MSGNKRDAAKAALRNVPLLHPDLIEPAVRMLEAAGVLENGGSVRAAATVVPGRECRTCIEAIAANEDDAVRIRRVIGEAKRLGFEIRANEKIDTSALDKALAGKDVRQRMDLKRNLAAMNLIP